MALTLLVTGTGKDGTFSACELIRQAYAVNGETCHIAHEPDVLALLNAHTRYLETSDPAWRDEIARIVSGWSLDVAVCGGADFCLDVFERQFGAALKVVHLKRTREAYLRSVLNATLANPESHGYYVDGDLTFSLYRPAAFHYGEMSRAQWDACSLEQRYAWFYDKVHQLFDEYRCRFDHTLVVETEKLSEPDTIDTLVRFINPMWSERPPAVHRNALRIVDHRDFTPAQRKQLHRLFVGLDIERLLASPLYPVNYFLQFVDAQLLGAAPEDELRAFLAKADEIRSRDLD